MRFREEGCRRGWVGYTQSTWETTAGRCWLGHGISYKRRRQEALKQPTLNPKMEPLAGPMNSGLAMTTRA